MSRKNFNRREIVLLRYLLLCICVFAAGLACKTERTDLRSLAPADTLVYVETDDLGGALKYLTESRAFREAARSAADFSPLEGVQAALAVTGFEAAEKQVTPENAVLDFRPRFVAVADTHAWNWQTLSFAENQLGRFVRDTYGGEVGLETSERSGGRFFTWTAGDGRRAFAFVHGSRIFFANDAGSIEKCMAVLQGGAESLAGTGKTVEKSENTLAAGFVTGQGVAQISNLAGVSVAIETTEEEEGRGFIARVLPQILRGSVSEIVWTAAKTEQGIEDRYTIALAPEVSSVLKETLLAGAPAEADLLEFVPADAAGVTRYNLENPRIAWRSVLLTAAQQTDPASAKILTLFSGSLFEPYGIADPEVFLSSVKSEIATAQMDADGERRVVIAEVRNAETLKKSIADIDFKAPPEKRGAAELWKSEEDDIAAAFVEGRLVLGDAGEVLRCVDARQTGQNFTKTPYFERFSQNGAAAVTFGRESTERVVEALGEKRAENLQMTTVYLTETRFSDKGFERRTLSPFGLLGTIVAQFAGDE